MNTRDLAFKSALSRRRFLQSSALALGATALSGPFLLRGQNLNSKLNIAQVGVMGKGESDTDCCSGENIYALCDVDRNSLEGRHRKYPQAQVFRDYRQMLEQIGKNLDAVIVSTPDNHHACAAIMAMKMRKHVYCQKPLTCSVYEAREMRKIAKEYKVVTQMGNQGSSESGLRRAVEVVQAGAIGAVHQIHVWSNRPIWPQGQDRPPGEDAVPDSLNWDLWIGPAAMRPFVEKYKEGRLKGQNVYHPFVWRGWQDFGTGALGDMACHTCNMPFRAAKLGYPNEIEAVSTGINTESYPLSSKIRFRFPEREGLPEVEFWWYDGTPGDPKTFRPTPDLTKEIVEMQGELPGSGCLLVGAKGKLFSPDDYGAQFFVKLNDEKEYVSGNKHEVLKSIPQTIPRNTLHSDTDRRHHLEWIEAIKGGPVPYSNFDIAAYLTEIILLGDVALRVGEKLEWDGPKMKATNSPKAAQFVRRRFRKGWHL